MNGEIALMLAATALKASYAELGYIEPRQTKSVGKRLKREPHEATIAKPKSDSLKRLLAKAK